MVPYLREAVGSTLQLPGFSGQASKWSELGTIFSSIWGYELVPHPGRVAEWDPGPI